MFDSDRKVAEVGPLVTAAANRGQAARGRAGAVASTTPARAPTRGASAR
jgi:hypothetical protein